MHYTTVLTRTTLPFLYKISMMQRKKFQWSIKIPHNVILKKQQNEMLIIGPLGTSKATLNRIDPLGDVAYKVKDNTLFFCSSSKSFFRAFSSLLANKIYGVTRGYLVYLRISGIGYRCVLENQFFKNAINNENILHKITKKGQILRLKVGFSHDLVFQIPDSIRLFLIEPTLICLYGIDKNQVTQIASKIREIQPPSVYKGKGIAFSEEVVILKQGKRK